MSLIKYHSKRDFKKTTEPRGRKAKKGQKWLYLIQKHAASHLHYDFRLELNGVLLSWAVPKGPSLDPSVKRLAVHVEDHPLDYGSFEGIIPAGQYGGGTVMLWDTGEWIPEETNPNAAYKKGHLRFILKGKKLKGAWNLVQIKSDPKNWLLIKVDDQYARPEDKYNILEDKTKSVVSRRTLEGIAKASGVQPKKSLKKSIKKNDKKSIAKSSTMPSHVSPELAYLVDEPPVGNEWLHEIKLDGYRLLCFIDNKAIKIMTRNQNDWTEKFPYLVAELKKLKLKSAILDGELIAVNEKKHSDFQILQNSIHHKDTAGLVYYAFDLLYENGKDLMSISLLQRKKKLHKWVRSKKGVIRYSDHVIGKGDALFKKACQLGLEGIVSKNIHEPYVQRRTHDWLKIKCVKRQEFVIIGFTSPGGSRQYFGSLLLGVYNKQGKLVYTGNVGTGFTQTSLKEIYSLLQKNKISTTPLTVLPKGIGKVTWVKPVLIGEVEFTEWTKDNALRHPTFKGLRSDKKPHQVRHEVAEKEADPVKDSNEQYPFTHPDKILYPKLRLTKLDVADYYRSVAKWMLPHVIKRPLTLVRCPGGVASKCFYQKHLDQVEIPGLLNVEIQEKADIGFYPYIKDEKGVLALVQLNALEIHAWGCHIDKLEKPDQITLDLDPADNVPWKKVIGAAHFIRKHLLELGLESFVKTSGGKGLHIVVPIQRRYGWKEVEIFTHTFVDYLVSLDPHLFIATMSKAKRKGKIFVDYLRNQRGSTAVVPYSTRARESAAVSTPLTWEELTVKIKSDSFTVKNINKRLEKLKKDPWRDFFKIKQSLPLSKKMVK